MSEISINDLEALHTGLDAECTSAEGAIFIDAGEGSETDQGVETAIFISAE